MTPIVPPAIAEYCAAHSSPASPLLDELERHTVEHSAHARMLSGAWEGALLRLLVALAGARRVIEIGTFTGYSALTMAEALPDDGELVSCDIDPQATRIAREFLDRSPHGGKVQLATAPALDTLKTLVPWFDLAFIDADKSNYSVYLDACLALLRSGGLIVADNVLWSGEVLAPRAADARAIVAFNEKTRNDARVECVMLPIRDGVSLIRKR